MQEFAIKIFSNIDFYERYSALSTKTRKNKPFLEIIDKKKVIEILESSGYRAKYVTKGNFYRITDETEHWKFNIHFSLKNGLVEIIFGLKDNSSLLGLGGTSSSICEDIQYKKGIKTEELIKKPLFSDYNGLEYIFKESLLIYEDLKNEVLKTNNPT